MTQVQTQHPDMQEFCSSKLWEMVSKDKLSSADDLEAAIEELARRRHYLAELEQLGKLRSQS